MYDAECPASAGTGDRGGRVPGAFGQSYTGRRGHRRRRTPIEGRSPAAETDTGGEMAYRRQTEQKRQPQEELEVALRRIALELKLLGVPPAFLSSGP